MEEKEKGTELLEVDDKGKTVEKTKQPEKPKAAESFTYVLIGFLFLVFVGLYLRIFVFYKPEIKNISLNTYETEQETNERAGKWLLKYVKKHQKAVIGLASGSSPKGLYSYVIGHKADVSFDKVKFVSLDAFCGVKKEDKNSYYSTLKTNFLNGLGVQDSQIHLIDEENGDCEKTANEYNEYLKENPVDVQILGYGDNGHFGFNQPGTPFDTVTRVIEMDKETFDAKTKLFGSADKTPKKAITQGIQTVLNAKNILVIANGDKKAPALAKLVKGVPNEDTPLSSLKITDGKVIIFADRKAASKL